MERMAVAIRFFGELFSLPFLFNLSSSCATQPLLLEELPPFLLYFLRLLLYFLWR